MVQAITTKYGLDLVYSIKMVNSNTKHYNCFFQVWRFLITFADVLGLWPFTLDEFVQAFHDYVSYLFLWFGLFVCSSHLLCFFIVPLALFPS